MDIPDLTGPFKLTSSNIALRIRGGALGAYVLGPLRADGHLTVRFIGRADDDLAGKLRLHNDKYDGFGFVRATSPFEAFRVECALYHHFEPVDNPVHPQRAAGTEWTCPMCNELD
jgi:hypothetical protein